MSSRPASFTEADIRRACKAAPGRVVEVHLPDGTIIRIVPVESEEVKTRVAERKEVRL